MSIRSSLPPKMRLGLLALFVAVLATHQTAGAQALPDYRLHPGDQIEVSVWGEEELQRTLLVRPDGKLSFPLAGEVDAANRTAADLQAEITTRLQSLIPEAVVTVSVTGIDGNRIYLIGQVENPGSFVMNPQITVLQALSLAGGPTPFAALNEILVVRGRGEDQRVFRFAYDDVKRGRGLEQNIVLESGDVVVVP
jgi:polysaccharide export outer membrane protein